MYHDNFNAGRSTFGNGIRNSGSGRIDHGNQSGKSQALKWKVDIVGIKIKSIRELVSWQLEVAKSQDSFAHASKIHVSSIKFILQLLIHWQILSFDVNGSAPIKKKKIRQIENLFFL